MTERKLITAKTVIRQVKDGTSVVLTAGTTHVVVAHDAKGAQVKHAVATAVLEKARAIAQKRVATIFSPEALKSAKAADKKDGVLIRGRRKAESSNKKPVLG